MERLPRNLISGNIHRISCPFLTPGCTWVTFQRLKLAEISPKLFHKGPSDLRLQSQAYIVICHHAFQIVIAKGRAIPQCFGNISLNVVPNAITLLCARFLHLMSFSDFVCELGLGMFDLKEFNLLRVLRLLCHCFVRIGAIHEATGATSRCRAHARENFGLEDFLARVVGMIS